MTEGPNYFAPLLAERSPARWPLRYWRTMGHAAESTEFSCISLLRMPTKYATGRNWLQ